MVHFGWSRRLNLVSRGFWVQQLSNHLEWGIVMMEAKLVDCTSEAYETKPDCKGSRSIRCHGGPAEDGQSQDGRRSCGIDSLGIRGCGRGLDGMMGGNGPANK